MKSTVIETKECIDWGKVQLLQGVSTDIVVLSNGIHNGNIFSGTVLNIGNSRNKIGHQINDFYKDRFEIFKGELKLSND